MTYNSTNLRTKSKREGTSESKAGKRGMAEGKYKMTEEGRSGKNT